MGALEVLCGVALVCALALAAASDLRARIIPNGCAAAVALSGAVRAVASGAPLKGVAGGAVVLLAMLAAARASMRGGRAPGVGGGDVKLLAAVGVWAGPMGGLAVVGLSCLFGAAWWGVRWVVAHVGSPPRAAPEGIALAPAIAVATPLVLVATHLLAF